MGKTILFSPVGGTDPIAESNYRDGSLLHICRHYKPDKVVLYMSAEMLAKHLADNRYLYCLDQLSKKENWEYEYEIIERPDLKEVQDFNYFYEEFQKLLKDIIEKMDEDDRLLLNVSSGTPPMKSALLVITTLGEIPCEIIQVSTPDKKRNIHMSIDEYEVETLWELDEDNQPDHENRCKEIVCPCLLKVKNEEQIKRHLEVYDYGAAYDVAKTMPKEYTRNYLEFLRMAKARMLLKFDIVDEVVKKTGIRGIIPIRNAIFRKYFEYTLLLDIKQKREEYVDFLRGITPIIVEMFEVVLREKYKIDIKNFTNKGDNGRKWSEKKLNDTLEGRHVLEVLNNAYQGDFKPGPVYSAHLCALIHDCEREDEKLLETIDSLRTVEIKVRNMAAHQIVSITNDDIKRLTGITSKQIVDGIKKLLVIGGIVSAEGYWKSYDTMNQLIIEKMTSY